MFNTLEEDEAGRVIFAIYNYVYNNIEPSTLSKVERGVFLNILSVIERKGKAYLNKIEAGTNNFRKANEERKQNQNNNKTVTSDNTSKVDNYPIPDNQNYEYDFNNEIDDNVPTYDNMINFVGSMSDFQSEVKEESISERLKSRKSR